MRILVVEDEPDTRELIASVLQRLGADVVMASSAEEALASFDKLRPHVMLSDLSLPCITGWELIRRLRLTPEGRAMPALAFSANASLEDARRALDAGFDVHLAKPMGSEALAEAVLSVVHRDR